MSEGGNERVLLSSINAVGWVDPHCPCRRLCQALAGPTFDSLLEPRDRLAERGSACFPVRCLELWQSLPFQQRVGRHTGRPRKRFDVAVREQGGNRFFLLPPELCAAVVVVAAALHLMQAAESCQRI